MRGTVKFFDRAKGWGFLTSEEGTVCTSRYFNSRFEKMAYLRH